MFCQKWLISLILTLIPSICFAHFGMLIPSQSMIDAGHKTIKLDISFSHPFEGHGMPLDKPGIFSVKTGESEQNLLSTLIPATIMGHQAWEADYTFKRPGVYSFYMEPAPYWEPSEDCFIIHYTKTIIGAYGEEEGWDEPVGLKTEIVPLTRPFGLYAGNVFQGQVLLDGKPVPGAEVEVEFYNKDHKAKAPSEYMVTQVVKADPNGIFTYAAPEDGWWGFAALNTADYKIKYKNTPKDVELGAVIWVQFLEWDD